jgi:hypothetical protein
MIKYLILFFLLALGLADRLVVEKHISDRVLGDLPANETEVKKILFEMNYLNRIKHTYMRLGIHLDRSNVADLWLPYFPYHGFYCGYYNDDPFKLPYDGIDWLCRVYKVCNYDSKYDSCFCNRQFYLGIMAYKPKYSYEGHIKDELISYLDEMVRGCPNYGNLMSMFHIGDHSSKGLNFLTFKCNRSEKFYEISSNSTFHLYEFTDDRAYDKVIKNCTGHGHLITNSTYVPNNGKLYMVVNPHNHGIDISVKTKEYVSNWCNVMSFFTGSIVVIGLITFFTLVFITKS